VYMLYIPLQQINPLRSSLLARLHVPGVRRAKEGRKEKQQRSRERDWL
jgi:hypothetical protein